jgi:ABC-type multidrug transport system fused ATPase/permease subunit
MEAVGTVIILGYLSPPLAAALVTVVPASSFLVQWLSKRVVASSQQASAAVAASAATADELLENISTVRAFAAEPFEQVRARVCVCVWVSCLCRVGAIRAKAKVIMLG